MEGIPTNPPPLKASEISAWAVGSAVGNVVAQGYLEDPEWADAVEKLEWDEENFGDFWGKMMSMVMKEIAHSTDFLKDEDDAMANIV